MFEERNDTEGWVNLNVDANEHPMLYAGMSLSPNSKVAFYYVTKDDAQWSERQVNHLDKLAACFTEFANSIIPVPSVMHNEI